MNAVHSKEREDLIGGEVVIDRVFIKRFKQPNKPVDVIPGAAAQGCPTPFNNHAGVKDLWRRYSAA